MALTGRRLTVTLAAALGAVIVIGAAGAFAVGRSQRLAGHAVAGGSSGAVTSPAGTAPGGSGSSSGASARPSSAAPPPGTKSSSSPTPGTPVTAPSPTNPSADNPMQSDQTPPAGGSTGGSTSPGGVVTIELSPRAEAAPQSQQVADLISRYFAAINRHDYDAWLTTVSTAQAKRNRDDWVRDYSTTSDSDVYISDITGTAKHLLVRMQFVSHQEVKYAPTAMPQPCIRWDVTYQVIDEGPGLRVGTSAQPPAMAPCT